MICENCRIDSDVFGHICSVCGGEVENNPGTMENIKQDISLAEIPAEKKILTSIEIMKNKAKKIARILWLID